VISGGSGDAAAVLSSWTKVSLAGTFALDSLTEQARDAGAKVVLVGDWAPLSPVELGTALLREPDELQQERPVLPNTPSVPRANSAPPTCLVDTVGVG
jgi:hypothetical protein